MLRSRISIYGITKRNLNYPPWIGGAPRGEADVDGADGVALLELPLDKARDEPPGHAAPGIRLGVQVTYHNAGGGEILREELEVGLVAPPGMRRALSTYAAWAGESTVMRWSTNRCGADHTSRSDVTPPARPR